MSPLVRKEVRALLPPWLLAMVLAAVPVWLTWPATFFYPSAPGYLVMVPFALGVLLLSLTPFGQELNWGTFSVLLAQPVSRSRIWRVKTVLLAVALALVLVAFLVSNSMWIESVVASARSTVYRTLLNRPGGDHNIEVMLAVTQREALTSTWMMGALGVLCGFAGGLWTTLLFRQVSAAFWFTLLVPLGLGLLTGLLGDIATCFVLSVYSGVGFFWARKQFQRVQDTQWTGGVVLLPGWGTGTKARVLAQQRKRRAVAALLRKELQAQYVNLMLAGALLVIHIGVVLVRRLGADYFAVHRTMGMTLESFPVLWVAMPLLVGSVAIAEERKLGTFETISCAPVSRRLQFGIKLVVTLVLGLLLGSLVPLLIEKGGAPSLRADMSYAFGFGIATVMPLAKLSLLAAFGVSLLAFYGSSLTRNTLQALGTGVMGCVAISLLTTVAFHPVQAYGVDLWGTRLLGLILAPAIIVTLLILAYRNYRQLHVTARLWRRNAMTLGFVLLIGTVVTTFVYHQFWEVWLPVEPRHDWQVLHGGPSPGRVEPKVVANGLQIAALLSDGRLWLQEQSQVQLRTVEQGPTPRRVIAWRTGKVRSGFVPGNDWRDVATSGLGCYAIQKDGSLWDLTAFEPGAGTNSFKRIDQGSGWAHVSAGGAHFSAVKADGTLWQWGYPFSDQSPPVPLSVPTQIGTETNWIAIAEGGQSSIAIKSDGSVWRWGLIQVWSRSGESSTNHLAPSPDLWLFFPGEHRPTFLSYNGYSLAAVCDDGTLWFGGAVLNTLLRRGDLARARKEMVRYDADSDWKQVSFPGTWRILAVKQNGSLVEWDHTRVLFGPGYTRLPMEPPSQYPVWTSVCSYRYAFLALGRDNKLCVWGDPEGNWWYDLNRPDPERLLLPSRIQAKVLANLAK